MGFPQRGCVSLEDGGTSNINCYNIMSQCSRTTTNDQLQYQFKRLGANKSPKCPRLVVDGNVSGRGRVEVDSWWKGNKSLFRQTCVLAWLRVENEPNEQPTDRPKSLTITSAIVSWGPSERTVVQGDEIDIPFQLWILNWKFLCSRPFQKNEEQRDIVPHRMLIIPLWPVLVRPLQNRRLILSEDRTCTLRAVRR